MLHGLRPPAARSAWSSASCSKICIPAPVAQTRGCARRAGASALRAVPPELASKAAAGLAQAALLEGPELPA
eukprot:11174154-Lingulodinium_polyedra.AAC.1